MAYSVTSLGVWETYTPDPLPPAAPEGASFARRVGDGRDWYALVLQGFPAGAVLATAVAVERSDGVTGYLVSSVQRDPSRLFPARAYLIQIEGVPQDEPAPHKLFEQQNFDPVALTITPFPPMSSEPAKTFKTDFWGRCTDDEATALFADLQEADVRMRAMFEAAQYIGHGDPLFATLQAAVTARVGAPRAAELLAPSEV